MRVGVFEKPRPFLGFRERDQTRGGFLMGHLGQEIGGGTPTGLLLLPGLDREAQLVHAAGAEQVPQGLLVVAVAGRIEVGGWLPRRMELAQPLDLGFDAGSVLLARVVAQGALVDLRRRAGGAAEHRRVDVRRALRFMERGQPARAVGRDGAHGEVHSARTEAVEKPFAFDHLLHRRVVPQEAHHYPARGDRLGRCPRQHRPARHQRRRLLRGTVVHTEAVSPLEQVGRQRQTEETEAEKSDRSAHDSTP